MATVTYNNVSMDVLGKIRIAGGSDSSYIVSFETDVTSLGASAFNNLRVWDKNLVIAAGTAYNITFSLTPSGGQTGAVSLRPSIGKPGAELDSDGRKLMTFSCEVIPLTVINEQSLPGVQWWALSIGQDPTGVFTLVISGHATANGGNGAQAVAKAAIPTIFALVSPGVPGGVFENPFLEYTALDRYDRTVMFNATYKQLAYPSNQYTTGDEGGAASRDPLIVFPRWSISRVQPADVGSLEVDVSVYTVRWTAQLRLTGGSAGPPPSPPAAPVVYAQELAAIRALVLDRLESEFGVSELVAEGVTEFSDDPTGPMASSTWTVRACGGLMEYNETVAIQYSGPQFLKVTDGAPFTGVMYTRGTVGDVVQSVTAIRTDGLAQDVTPPTVVAGGAAVTLVPISAASDFNKRFNPLIYGGSGKVTVEGSKTAVQLQRTYKMVAANASFDGYARRAGTDPLGGG